MFELDTFYSLLLILCLLAAVSFEFINGFHDTANAVATVIYTHSLKPTVAVVWSGFWNFIGVNLGKVIPGEEAGEEPLDQVLGILRALAFATGKSVQRVPVSLETAVD